MAETALMLAVHTPLDDLRNREIKSNIADLLPIVQAKAEEYKATQYGITQEKLCREHRAVLNKFVTSINDELREIGKANNAPFEAFSNEVKLITDVVKDAIASLDRQLTEMETVWRTNNLENAKILYDEIIGSGNTANWIPFEKILITKKTGRVSFEDFFGNKGSWSYKEGLEDTKDVEELISAGKKVAEELERFRERAIDAWCAVNNVDYSEEIINKGIDYLKGSYDPVKKGFDVEGAFNLMMTLNRQEREKQQAVEEAKRRAELEKQQALMEQQKKLEEEKLRAVEEAEKKATIPGQVKVTDYIPNAEEKVYHLKFESTMTMTQAKRLRAFCDANGITLKIIN